MIFIPDTTGPDLREQERYWQFVREGRVDDYHGIAIHPRHLSWFERSVLKRDRNYDPVLDRKGKIEELRLSYTAASFSTGKEGVGSESDDLVSDKVSRYFEWEQMKEKSSQSSAHWPFFLVMISVAA